MVFFMAIPCLVVIGFCVYALVSSKRPEVVEVVKKAVIVKPLPSPVYDEWKETTVVGEAKIVQVDCGWSKC